MTTSTQTIPKGYKQTEIGVIPTDWEIKQLGDVGEIRMCRRIFNHQTKEKGAIPFYKIGTFGNDADAYIPEDLYDSYRRRFSFPKKGDILISAAGTIGRTIVYDGRPAYFQDSNIIWIDNNEKLISNSYLYYVLQIAKYNTEGGTIQRLYNNILNSTKFICPLKPEQSAIATILSDTDSLIAKLEALIEKKKNIKQGTMQELLTGKRRLSGFSDKWEIKSLGDLVDVKDGTHQTPKYFDEGIPFYSVESITSNNFEDTKYISISEHKLLTKNFKIEKGDILMTRIGSIGDCKLITWEPNASFYVSLALLKPKNKQTSLYIYHFSKTDFFKKELEDRSLQWAVPKKINLGEISKIKIHLPVDSKEQSAIATVLSDMDTEIEKLESQLTKYRNLKQGMMQTLLTGKIRLLSK